uniref:Uncharacterized protein n=1 Tax=Salix viminalis TaxID=40686 RepID=A0A6N2M768_SALVM
MRKLDNRLTADWKRDYIKSCFNALFYANYLLLVYENHLGDRNNVALLSFSLPLSVFSAEDFDGPMCSV